MPFEKWERRDHFEWVAESYNISPRCCLISNDGEATHGLPFRDAVRVAKAADLFINVSGRLRTQEIVGNVACRAYIDLDPGITQVYHAESRELVDRAPPFVATRDTSRAVIGA